jgi:hypothetical protein
MTQNETDRTGKKSTKMATVKEWISKLFMVVVGHFWSRQTNLLKKYLPVRMEGFY